MSVRLAGVTLDCPDPAALSRFYTDLAGWSVAYDSDDFVFLMVTEGAPGVGFARVPHHTPPRWPDGTPQQFHLDFYVDDVTAARDRAVALGATPAEFQPGGDKWTVMLDPAGHPFCLTRQS